jgi:hypothetical protein
MDATQDPDDPSPMRSGTCPTHGEFCNFSGRCLACIMRKCCCCGFTSDNRRLFVHPNDLRLQSRELWICKSEKKCRERSHT